MQNAGSTSGKDYMGLPSHPLNLFKAVSKGLRYSLTSAAFLIKVSKFILSNKIFEERCLRCMQRDIEFCKRYGLSMIVKLVRLAIDE